MNTTKCITYHGTRQKPNEPLYDFGERKQTIPEALVSLMIYEIGFGGQLVAATDTDVRVRTQVLHCDDVTTFSGTAEDMKPLLTALALKGLLEKEHGDALTDAALKRMEQPGGGYRPFDVVHFMPLLRNQRPAKAVLLAAIGVTEKEDLEAGMKVKDEDLAAVIELLFENPGRSLRDVAADLGLIKAAA